jgi:hypothetical protein
MCERQIVQFFRTSSVKANWGEKRTYKITDIDFSHSPFNFNVTISSYVDGKCISKSVTMAEYFKDRYKIVLKEKNQPLFVVKKKNDVVLYLPSEICNHAGLPPEMRKDFRLMKILHMKSKVEPDQKLSIVEGLSKDLNKNSVLRDWGLQLTQKSEKILGEILDCPLMRDPINKSKTMDITRVNIAR